MHLPRPGLVPLLMLCEGSSLGAVGWGLRAEAEPCCAQPTALTKKSSLTPLEVVPPELQETTFVFFQLAGLAVVQLLPCFHFPFLSV